jgi:hypothetical protein
MSAVLSGFNLEEFRSRLGAMTDSELIGRLNGLRIFVVVAQDTASGRVCQLQTDR